MSTNKCDSNIEPSPGACSRQQSPAGPSESPIVTKKRTRSQLDDSCLPSEIGRDYKKISVVITPIAQLESQTSTFGSGGALNVSHDRG